MCISIYSSNMDEEHHDCYHTTVVLLYNITKMFFFFRILELHINSYLYYPLCGNNIL